MTYFKTNINDDMLYLLEQIGHNCTINNVTAKAIINNTKQERTYDDKVIITHEELRRGYYIRYADLYFLLLSEVNDKRYLNYYKGIMRACNFDIKFIVDDKLYLFHSIIEGDKFFISENKIMDISADSVTVTLPNTAITSKLKKLNSFILWGRKWQIEGIDYTKNGLIVLNCKVREIGNNDDLENEIADRYRDLSGGGNEDVLNGDITPILPFGDAEVDPVEPEEPEPVDPPSETTYTITVETPYYNDDEDILSMGETYKYTVHKFDSGVEIDGEFTFELTDDSNAQITHTGKNLCDITAGNMIFGMSTTILKVTDIERLINVRGR